MKKLLALSILAVALVLGSAVTVYTQDKAQGDKVLRTASNVVNGEISGISKKSISVVYNKDIENDTDYEMLIPIDKDVQVEHKKSLSELKIGDSVSIEYEDTTTEDSAKQKKMTRKAKVVSFVRSAPPAPPSTEE